jgi:long-chain acyl-CoA synthetase
MKYDSLTDYISGITDRFGDSPALAFVGEKPLTYRELIKSIKWTAGLMKKNGFKPGDKAAILSENQPLWGVAYFAITWLGGVMVPILPDFSPSDIANIIEHSGCSLVFTSRKMVPAVEKSPVPLLILEDLETSFEGIKPESYPWKWSPDDLAVIIYTSGTTGQSKGVMLTHKNLLSNAESALPIADIQPGDSILSILPLSHTYECTIGFIIPLLAGAQIHYLKKPPSPSVLMPALAEVRPHVMLSVPLLIEKVFQKSVLPKIQASPVLKGLYKIPLFRKLINKKAGKTLYASFGGRLYFFGIGGAQLSWETERFLREGKFPYAIGYGLTETSPLIAGANARDIVFRSTGPILKDVEVKLDTSIQNNGEGEILVKGPNVMAGYYRDEEKTKAVFTDDGWFRTGDLGSFDAKGNLFIRGRLKNVILGPSGENIYPEIIEELFNSHEFVEESLVYQDKGSGSLVAKIHLNYDKLKEHFEHLKHDVSGLQDEAAKYLQSLKEMANRQLSKFSRIMRIEEQPVPFDKTPTKKIKRYLYTERN